MSKMAVSYSRLNTFKTCPKQFEHLYILKDVQDEGSVHTQYGERVHKSLEMYGKTRDPAHLTDETREYATYVDDIVRKYPDAMFEQQLTLDGDMLPCDWFSSDAWIRGILDVSIIDGAEAITIDWKTGKVKPDPEQFKIFSSLVFNAYPEVQKVTCVFVWLKHTDATTMAYTRAQADTVWASINKRIDAVQEAVDTGVFPSKPSPLCGWCAAQEVCPDAQRKRR